MAGKKSRRIVDRMIHIRLSADLHKSLRVRAAEEDVSIQVWVAELIDRTLAPRGRSKRS